MPQTPPPLYCAEPMLVQLVHKTGETDICHGHIEVQGLDENWDLKTLCWLCGKRNGKVQCENEELYYGYSEATAMLQALM